MRLESRIAVALFASCLFLSTAPSARGQDVIPHRQDRAPNRPYSPEEALEAMTVPPGFTVELVASEPDIVNPIAMAFDDRGRIWVTESLEYPRKSPGPGRDRVKILEDRDGDGTAEAVRIFADNLNIPTGIAVGHGGVWVLDAPDLFFYEVKDDKPVRREVVLTGFGRADMHELPSTLTWGPDGFLYGLNGVFNPSEIRSGDRTYKFTCALWRLDPRTRKFEVVCEGTSNPYGLAWDNEGSAIVEACHWANEHLFHFVENGYYKRQAGAYPPYTIKLGAISDHSHQKTAYCGLAYFDSDAYPPQYRERLFTGNIHGGCINTDVLTRVGSTYLSRAEPDFLSAHDAWFMPVAQKVGPDGCFYILDWYDRYHCYQDANRDPEGIDRLKGRLYRVRYGDSPRAGRFDLASESDEALIARLASPNIYFREAAQRILTERNAPIARVSLKRLVLDSTAPRKPRMHALWALVGTGRLESQFHLALLASDEPAYRAWGVRAAGNHGTVARPIRERIAALAHDENPDVQLQVAIAARKVQGLDSLPVLVDVLATCGEDRMIPGVAWPSLHPLLAEQPARFVKLVEPVALRKAPALAALLPRALERMLGEPDGDLEPVRRLLARVVEKEPALAEPSLAAVSDAVRELSPNRKEMLRAQLEPLLARLQSREGSLALGAVLLAARLGSASADASAVRARFEDEAAPEAVRLRALEALVAFKDRALADSVGRVLDANLAGDSPFLARVLAALGPADDPKLADAVLARLPKLPAETQPLAIDLLLEREPWARKLLDAVLAKKLPRETLSPNHLRKILESNDREAVWAVEKAFGTVRSERNPDREKVVAAMGQYLREHPGDPRAGHAVFRKLCIQCHTIYGEGVALGPDLTSNGRGSFDQLVTSVFDPSLVIGPAYQATTVVTEDGRNLTGLVTEDSPARVVLALPGGAKETIGRNNVKYTHVSKLSMMPEGIETVFDRQELADLFAYLALDGPPGDPGARPIPGAPVAATRSP